MANDSYDWSLNYLQSLNNGASKSEASHAANQGQTVGSPQNNRQGQAVVGGSNKALTRKEASLDHSNKAG